jgi:predicted ribosomally synthesized peptide with SipW-like signal peptide
MNKRILVSLSVIGVAAAAIIGGTIAYFNDTETSTGNIFTAGSIDLKVDHVWQTYNDIDCNTCQVTVKSDTSNVVVEKNGETLDSSYYAVLVNSIHPRWTAQNDPILDAANAEWIWESDPTRQEDTTQDVTYTFRNEFEWWGPITGSDLYFAVGSDNTVKVYLNDVLIGENTSEYGYQQDHMLHIAANDVTDNVEQGNNVLEFVVKNMAQVNGNPTDNPAGLIYKFSIDGMCDDNYFKTYCRLWGEKDLEDGDTFFSFDDVKPGDLGVNVISLHVYDNNAWACLIADDFEDYENELQDPEADFGDESEDKGELSNYLNAYVWHDDNQNLIPDGGETVVGDSLLRDLGELGIFDSGNEEYLNSTTTKYVGIAWCAGDISFENGSFTCDGSTMKDDAQSDSFTASLTAYAEQWRNNQDFLCSGVELNPEDQNQESE